MAGDATAAWIIGLTYLHKYISLREEGKIIATFLLFAFVKHIKSLLVGFIVSKACC
jgi:hypothetical protein